jgi:hypothetical protein
VHSQPLYDDSQMSPNSSVLDDTESIPLEEGLLQVLRPTRMSLNRFTLFTSQRNCLQLVYHLNNKASPALVRHHHQAQATKNESVILQEKKALTKKRMLINQGSQHQPNMIKLQAKTRKVMVNA